MWNIVLGAVIGAFTSIGTTIAVEYLRRPQLHLFIEDPPLDVEYPFDRPARNLRTLRISLTNTALPRWAKWMVRTPALQCHAAITFHHLDGQNIFGRVMAGRWAASPQPIPMPIIGPDGQQFQLIDYMRLTVDSRIDVFPGETELLDIVARADDDSECYGWNNEAYFSTPPWRNPRWKLPSGRYLTRVVVTSSGQKCVGNFRLIGDVARSDFRLLLANNTEVRLLEQ